MTRRFQFLAGAALVAFALTPLILRGQQSPRELFERARIVEEANQDLKQAIRLYEQAAAQAKGDRALAAQALLRMAEAHQKLGNAQATSIYERLVRDYADQKEAAAQARVRLATLEPGTSARNETAMTNRRVWSGTEVDTQGGVSTGGRYLTHQDQETGDLAVRSLQTGEKRRLTNAPPSWAEFADSSYPSADGRFVAYWWYNKEDKYELRVVSTAGDNESVKPRTLSHNKEVGQIQPAGWSPDNKSILAYLSRADGTHQIALIDASNGATKVLKSLDWRSTNKLGLSPDGRYVAYDFPPNEESPEHDIYVLASDGSREVRVVEHPGDDLLLGWVPDGQAILFASDRTGTTDVWKLPVAAGKPSGPLELVKRDIGRITPLGFSANGAFYYGSESGIRDAYTVAIDPKSLEPLAAPALVAKRFQGTNQGADWSADGKYLAYASRRGQVWHSPSLICIRSVETGAEREIMPQLAWIISYHGLRWSRDGRYLFVEGKDRKGHHGLYKVNAQTGQTDPVVIGNVGVPVCSPDGETLNYLRGDEADGVRIMAWNLRDESEREVFRKLGGWSPFAMSPDGTHLAFVTKEQRNSENKLLMVIPSQGGEPRVVLRAPRIYAFGLSWTPDGEQLLFSKWSENTFDLQRISIDTGEQHFVHAFPKFASALRISPDGRQLAYTAGDVKREVWVLENFLHGLTAKK